MSGLDWLWIVVAAAVVLILFAAALGMFQRAGRGVHAAPRGRAERWDDESPAAPALIHVRGKLTEAEADRIRARFRASLQSGRPPDVLLTEPTLTPLPAPPIESRPRSGGWLGPWMPPVLPPEQLLTPSVEEAEHLQPHWQDATGTFAALAGVTP